MEEAGPERSSSPSGSEDSESESKQGYSVENGKESEEEEEEQDGNSKDSSSSDSDDSDDDDDDDSEHSGAKSEGGDERNIGGGGGGDGDELSNAEEHSSGGYPMEGVPYPLGDLPLEVITTVEPTNFAYPVLKNMSNGVLTHRNIFTEAERSVLVGIINKYRNIVDTRSRTREIYLEKQNVWQQIVEEYNSTENIMVRTEKELRKCWDNMKYRAKQAEKEMFKVEVKAEEESEPVIKMEQPEHDAAPVHFATDYEGVSEDPWQCGETGLEEEREPALKKARQESPKLSSLLLAAAQKRSPGKKFKSNTDTVSKNSIITNNNNNNNNNHNNNNNNSNSFPYSIPSCTKVMHVKKKGQSGMPPGLSSQDIPILPKGLASCLSITNIPNPAGPLANCSRESISPGTSPVQASLKPMPSLRKMVPSKHHHGTMKGSNMRPSKKSNGLSSKVRGHTLAPSPEKSLSPVPGEMEGEERLLNTRLVNQRLQMEQREHELRMRLLEKELQAHSFQCQYWSLRLKLLRSGRDVGGGGSGGPLNLAGATNGDID